MAGEKGFNLDELVGWPRPGYKLAGFNTVKALCLATAQLEGRALPGDSPEPVELVITPRLIDEQGRPIRYKPES